LSARRQGHIFIVLKGGVENFEWGASGTTELRQGLGLKTYSHKIGGVKRNFDGVEHLTSGLERL
jgi:hypothetical protein